jgi:hypothetical protein
MYKQQLQSEHINKVPFQAVVNILDKWNTTLDEKLILLGLKRSTFFKYLKEPEHITASKDLLERLSYLFNIHAALRILFLSRNPYMVGLESPIMPPFIMVSLLWILCCKERCKQTSHYSYLWDGQRIAGYYKKSNYQTFA